jgi:hypothetical protein
LRLLCNACGTPFGQQDYVRTPSLMDAEMLAQSAAHCNWKQVDGLWYCPEHRALAERSTLVPAEPKGADRGA